MNQSFEFIREVVLDLVNKEQHKLAFGILDYYFTKAKTLADLDIIGQLALKTVHTDLSIKAAEASYSLAETNEQRFTARTNLSKAYYAANYPEKALEYTWLNLEERPNDFDSIIAYAAALKLNNQRKESEEIIDKLFTLDLSDKQKKELEITLTHPVLRSGRTAEGIELFLRKDDRPETIFDMLNVKAWSGIPQPGRTVYVNAQGGYGDEFINIRFFKHIKDLGMTPVLYDNLQRSDMFNVLTRNGFEVISDYRLIDTSELWTNFLMLPYDLNVNESNLWYGPYIKPLKQKKNNISSKKFKIGIKCSGNPYFAQDVVRSVPIDEILKILPEDVEVYYFDIEKSDPRVINLKDKISSWEDTLDFISQMDIILSSCTSIVHASGAMGIPTIVLVPILEYYVWTTSRTDTSTPWYGDNYYVCKQQKVRCWQHPLNVAKTIIHDLKAKK